MYVCNLNAYLWLTIVSVCEMGMHGISGVNKCFGKSPLGLSPSVLAFACREWLYQTRFTGNRQPLLKCHWILDV